MKQIEVVAAIIRKGDKIFATQRGYGEWKDWWEFPGGKMEIGETPEEALKYIFRSIPVQHSGAAVSSQKCKNRLFLMFVRP